MKKIVAFILTLVLLANTSLVLAEKPSFNQMVDKINNLFINEGIEIVKSSESEPDKFSGVVINWISLSSFKILSFSLYDKELNQGYYWKVSDFSKMGAFLKEISSDLDMYFDFNHNGVLIFLMSQEDDNGNHFSKSIAYTPTVNLFDIYDDPFAFEYCDSLESFVDCIMYWSDAYAEIPDGFLGDLDSNSPQLSKSNSIYNEKRETEIKENNPPDYITKKYNIGIAFADPFSIRNGITFDSTLVDVKAVEKNNNNITLNEEYDANNDGSIDELIYKGTILGYDESSVSYYFEKSSKRFVRAIDYRFFGTMKGNEKYTEFKQDLTNKYGTPFIDDAEKSFPLFLKEYTYILSYGNNDIRGHNNPFSDYRLVSQWLSEYLDCIVIITLCTEYNDFRNDYECFIYYDLYTKDEIDASLTTVQEKLNIKQQQKNSDL